MIKVLVFFNVETCKVVTAEEGMTSIVQKYPNGEEAQLQIMSASFPSLTGDRNIIYVASDRELSSQEILDAAKKYL